MADTTDQIYIDLAVYMESFDSELEDLRDWRSRFYGAKSLMFLMGILLAHGAAVIASMVTVSSIMND